jgi:hypothetical protein
MEWDGMELENNKDAILGLWVEDEMNWTECNGQKLCDRLPRTELEIQRRAEGCTTQHQR